jgi:histidine phosphotransferase ChpT
MSAPDRQTADLGALVAARLCHDLISPMGAIRNGLELLQMSSPGAEAGAERGLISDSLETALAKLHYFRIAFGPADPRARQSFGEAVQATDAMFTGRFTVAWTTRGLDMPRPTARMIHLAILCLEKSLPMGGLVRVSVAEDAIHLAVEGRRTAPPTELWAHVTEGRHIVDLRPDCVQFALLRQALGTSGHRLVARFTETGATLSLAEVSPQLA